jgi:hypothetical protein
VCYVAQKKSLFVASNEKKYISVSSDQVTVVHFSEMMEIKNKKFDINTFFNYISAKNLLPL